MTCVLPMRKIMSMIWKPAALKKKKRMPGTLVDCLEVSKMKNVTFRCRPWLSFVLGLALIYSLYVLMYKLPSKTREERDDRDIKIIRYISSKTACGIGCNMAEVSSKTNTSIADRVAFGNPAPSTPRSTVQLPKCRIEINKGNDPDVSYRAHKFDISYRKIIKAGGYYKPQGCEPLSKVAIIVPYRNRKANLLVFLYNIHPFLARQMLQYRIFVIEQSGHEKFNKGRLFNAGFDHAARFGTWDCMVFHDVNLLPLNAVTSYSCPSVPTQMTTSVVWLNKTYPHVASFGGVMSVTAKHFRAVNGYSNLYWGSAGADASNMWWRLRAAHLPVQKYEKSMGLYSMLPQLTEPDVSGTRHNQVATGDLHERYMTDGLANCHYKTISIRLRSMFTHIVVDINPNKDLIQ